MFKTLITFAMTWGYIFLIWGCSSMKIADEAIPNAYFKECKA